MTARSRPGPMNLQDLGLHRALNLRDSEVRTESSLGLTRAGLGAPGTTE